VDVPHAYVYIYIIFTANLQSGVSFLGYGLVINCSFFTSVIVSRSYRSQGY